MANTDDIDRAADALRDSVSNGAASNVDDILTEILGGNGAYSTGYHDMFSKYSAQSAEVTPEETTGRIGGNFPRRDYGAEADAALAADRRVEENISRKMAPSVRNAVQRESQDVQRPEFTVNGGVRYPSRGVGESGERVVFDADWEEEAKEEAARISSRVGGMPSYIEPSQSPFRFTGAEEPPAHREITPPERPLRRPVPEETAAPAEEEKDAAISFFPEDFAAYRPAPPAPEPEPEPVPETPRGLSPEIQQTVDNAVLEAFSCDFDSDAAFKARWAETVEKAERRKEKKAKEAQEEEARRRSQQKLEEQQRKVAEMEEELELTPPPPQKGTFTLPPPPAEEELAVSPVTERLDEELAELAHVNTAAAAENTIKKTKKEQISFFFKTHFSKEGLRRFCRVTFPVKGDGAKESVRKIVRFVSCIVLICGLVYLAFYARNYIQRIKTDAEMGTEILESPSLSESELQDSWADLKARYPDVEFPEGMDIRFAERYAMNSDTVGYLSIEEKDTGGSSAKKAYRIQTVLMQGPVTDFYLYHDFYKKYSRYGNPYVMQGCDMGPDGLSKNTIVYGHNTHDHLIFNRLEDYMTVDGYLSAPIITLDTLYETTKWKIFAVMLTNADPIDDNGYVFDYLYANFSSDSAFMSKMDQIRARSMIHTGVDVEPGDKTLMLYTCYRNRFSSGRLVIVARQLREGESETVNSSLVYYDSSAIFPAAYYTGTPKTTREATTEEPTTEPTTKAPDTPDTPSTEEPATAERTTAERTTAERTNAERTTAERTTAERTTAERTTKKDETEENTTEASTTEARTTTERTTEELTDATLNTAAPEETTKGPVKKINARTPGETTSASEPAGENNGN